MTLVRPEFDRPPLDRTPMQRTRGISTKALSDSLTQVATPGEVLGFVRIQWNGYAALRGSHLATAVEVGCYASHGMALEALRQRPRSI